METVASLYKCDKFEFNHLLVIMYEAEQIESKSAEVKEDIV